MEIKNKEKQYKSIKNLVYSCQYHVIFVTKYCRKVLTDDISQRLKELVLERQEEFDYEILDIEIRLNYVHLVLDTNPRIGVYTVANRIKGTLQRILREEFPILRSRLPSLWNRSKLISSVGAIDTDTIGKYVEDQKGK